MPRHTRYGAATRERAYHLWVATARNASATARLLQAEASVGAPVPTARSIRYWARRDHWAARADRRFGPTTGRTGAELMAKSVAVLQGELDVVLRLLDSAGELADAGGESYPRPARRLRQSLR